MVKRPARARNGHTLCMCLFVSGGLLGTIRSYYVRMCMYVLYRSISTPFQQVFGSSEPSRSKLGAAVSDEASDDVGMHRKHTVKQGSRHDFPATPSSTVFRRHCCCTLLAISAPVVRLTSPFPFPSLPPFLPPHDDKDTYAAKNVISNRLISALPRPHSTLSSIRKKIHRTSGS